jgi:hypothetical protein
MAPRDGTRSDIQPPEVIERYAETIVEVLADPGRIRAAADPEAVGV